MPTGNPKPEVKFSQLFINNEWVDAESGKTFQTKGETSCMIVFNEQN